MSVISCRRVVEKVRAIIPQVGATIDPAEVDGGQSFVHFESAFGRSVVLGIDVDKEKETRRAQLAPDSGLFGEGFTQSMDATHLGDVALQVVLRLHPAVWFTGTVCLAVVDMGPNIGLPDKGRLKAYQTPEEAYQEFRTRYPGPVRVEPAAVIRMAGFTEVAEPEVSETGRSTDGRAPAS